MSKIKQLRCGDRMLTIGARTYVMGVINVTPDSFSDGGLAFSKDHAVAYGQRLLEEGADIIDVGGVASSPKLAHDYSVSEEEEYRRVIPVIKELAARNIRNISVDTWRASIAEAALDAGASWINDQWAGLRDPLMPKAMAKADAIVLMHNSGGPSGVDAGERIIYHDIIDHLIAFFSDRIDELESCGVDANNIIIDPGVGFGKGLKDSLAIINELHRLDVIDAVRLIGLSRKSFLYPLTGIENPVERDYATLGANAAAIVSGAHIIRTHNVRASVEMARVLDQCLSAKAFEMKNENLH